MAILGNPPNRANDEALVENGSGREYEARIGCDFIVHGVYDMG